MRKRFALVQTTVQDFFNPKSLLSFLFGALCLSIAGNAVYTAISTPQEWWRQSIIALSALLVILVLISVMSAVIRRSLNKPPTVFDKLPDKRRGLIYLVSPGAKLDPARKAFDYHQPKRCWLLASVQSLPNADTLRAEFIRQGATVPAPIIINDIDDPLEVRRLVDKIYCELPKGWKAVDVISDYTGMTASCSVGMVLACLNSARPIEFTTTRYDDDGNTMGPGNPKEIIIDWGKLLPPPAAPVRQKSSRKS